MLHGRMKTTCDEMELFDNKIQQLMWLGLGCKYLVFDVERADGSMKRYSSTLYKQAQDMLGSSLEKKKFNLIQYPDLSCVSITQVFRLLWMVI